MIVNILLHCALYCYSIQVKLLNRDLPENVDLITLEPRSDGNFLLRLEHIFNDVDSKDVLAVPAVVPLKVRCRLL